MSRAKAVLAAVLVLGGAGALTWRTLPEWLLPAERVPPDDEVARLFATPAELLALADSFPSPFVLNLKPHRYQVAFLQLLKSSEPEASFLSLLQSPRPAAKLYGLCGLYSVNRDLFQSERGRLERSNDDVVVHGGCEINSDEVGRLVRSPEFTETCVALTRPSPATPPLM